MRKIAFVFLVFLCGNGLAQNSFMGWGKVGVKGKIVKRFDWDAELNARVGRNGLETFFPQVGITYKLQKWVKPSLEYRFIIDKNQIGNYKSSHRLNANLNFEKEWKGVGAELRVRYQYAFNRVNTLSYDPDFDQAIRLKPAISYKIPNSIFTPDVSCEFFYDPLYGPRGQRFTKLRAAIGSKIKLSKQHSLSIKYQIDKRIRDYGKGIRNVIAVSYSYKL